MTTITIIAIQDQTPSSIYSNFAKLHIYSNTSGIATISVSPVGAIDFPSQYAVGVGETEITGEILQFGTHTVTVTLNGVSDTAIITAEKLPNNVYIGPETILYYNGEPITTKLTAYCARPNTTLQLTSTGAGITIPSEVYCDAGATEVPCEISNYGEFTVKATFRDDESVTAIHVQNVPVNLYLEAPKEIKTEDFPLEFTMRCFCSRDGVVSLFASPSGITVPDTVNIVNGKGDFLVSISTPGLKYITAVFGDTYSETSIQASETGAIVVSLGEDRFFEYNGQDIVSTKMVFSNKDGTVYLSCPDLDIPASVEVVNGVAYFDVTITSGDINTIVTATHEYGPQATCRIVSVEQSIYLSLGQNRTFYVIGTEEITVPMTVFSSRDGTVTLSSDNAVVPASVNVVHGTANFNAICSINSTITAQLSSAIASCNIVFEQRASTVRIGPNGVNLSKLTVVTNRPGTVNLSVEPNYGYAIPSSVIVGSNLSADINCTIVQYGTYTVTASFNGDQASCTVECISPDSNYCQLFGTIRSGNGRPVRNQEIVFSPTPVTQFIQGKLVVLEPLKVHTNIYGFFSVKILRGASILIDGKKHIVVPDQESLEITL